MLSSLQYDGIVCNNVATVSVNMLSSMQYDGIVCNNVATVSGTVCCVGCSMMALCVIMWQQHQNRYVV